MDPSQFWLKSSQAVTFSPSVFAMRPTHVGRLDIAARLWRKLSRAVLRAAMAAAVAPAVAPGVAAEASVVAAAMTADAAAARATLRRLGITPERWPQQSSVFRLHERLGPLEEEEEEEAVV